MTKASEVAERITAARIGERRSVAWLSDETDIPEKTLRRRLRRPESFTIAELSAVARALHCDVQELLGRAA